MIDTSPAALPILQDHKGVSEIWACSLCKPLKTGKELRLIEFIEVIHFGIEIKIKLGEKECGRGEKFCRYYMNLGIGIKEYL